MRFAILMMASSCDFQLQILPRTMFHCSSFGDCFRPFLCFAFLRFSLIFYSCSSSFPSLLHQPIHSPTMVSPTKPFTDSEAPTPDSRPWGSPVRTLPASAPSLGGPSVSVPIELLGSISLLLLVLLLQLLLRKW